MSYEEKCLFVVQEIKLVFDSWFILYGETDRNVTMIIKRFSVIFNRHARSLKRVFDCLLLLTSSHLCSSLQVFPHSFSAQELWNIFMSFFFCSSNHSSLQHCTSLSSFLFNLPLHWFLTLSHHTFTVKVTWGHENSTHIPVYSTCLRHSAPRAWTRIGQKVFISFYNSSSAVFILMSSF